jgi:hypothetical protein
VAFELKTSRFEPEHMGKLAFYLEALDRDRKRAHESPSIGALLCRTKDDEVVEYAMSRHLSPALVVQYQTKMIPKSVLQQKLHEWNLYCKFLMNLKEGAKPPTSHQRAPFLLASRRSQGALIYSSAYGYETRTSGASSVLAAS